jgi:hypothetical protein
VHRKYSPFALAVNTLARCSTNNDVRKGGTILKNERGILFASLLLFLAG